MNEKELEEQRKANISESNEAAQLARESQERDIRNGQRPITTEVAESVMIKLKDQFGDKQEPIEE